MRYLTIQRANCVGHRRIDVKQDAVTAKVVISLAFADTGRAGHEHIHAVADPAAGGQRRGERLAEATRGAEINGFGEYSSSLVEYIVLSS